jgi:anti-anti-sigma regulatory factor
MGIVLRTVNESSVIALEGAIDISSAAELKAALLASINAGKSVSLSIDEDTAIDITAFQLLWAVKQAAIAQGESFTFSGQMPQAATGLLKDAGLEVSQLTT